MAFVTQTILQRITPFPVPDGKGDHPLNKIQVVGPSPVRSALDVAWANAPGDHIIVTPYGEFGSNEIIPESILQTEYEVVEYGEEVETRKKLILEPPTRRAAATDSPETVFAREERQNRRASEGDPVAQAEVAARAPKTTRKRTANG